MLLAKESEYLGELQAQQRRRAAGEPAGLSGLASTVSRSTGSTGRARAELTEEEVWGGEVVLSVLTDVSFFLSDVFVWFLVIFWLVFGQTG